MDFQLTVIGIALLALIVCLIIIAMTFSKGGNMPTPDACPDYWTTSNLDPKKCVNTEFGCCADSTPKKDADGTNCKIKCYNSHKLGKVSSTCTSIPVEMDFSSADFSGANSLCAKQKWASQCGITWDGITNVSQTC